MDSVDVDMNAQHENTNSNRKPYVKKCKIDEATVISHSSQSSRSKKNLEPQSLPIVEVQGDQISETDVASDLDQTHATEFVEDGEIIRMEINDGGAAAQEFASDNESSGEETASDGELDMTVSQTVDKHPESDHSDNDQQIEEYNTVEYQRKQAEKCKKKSK